MEKIENRFLNLLNVRKKARLIGSGERLGHKVWKYYGLGKEGYQDTLGSFWSAEPIDLHTQELLDQDKAALVMDLAGPGQVLREIPHSGALAVTLGDGRAKGLKEFDKSKHISVLEGDILSKRTWRNIKNWLTDQKSPGFDLILCNPEGGFEYFPKDLGLYYYLAQQIWDTLNPDKGEFYCGIPSLEMIVPLELWLRQVSEQSEIEVSSTRYSFKVVRNLESPAILPKLA